jgi:putative sterol carrier protein
MARRRGSSVRTPTDAFFDGLAARGNEPLMRSASGTVRFDLADGDEVEHWYVTMRGGGVEVSHKKANADALVRLDRDAFDGMVSGTVNAMAATLRGELEVEGDLGLVMLFQRLFPPPATAGAAETAAKGGSGHE